MYYHATVLIPFRNKIVNLNNRYGKNKYVDLKTLNFVCSPCKLFNGRERDTKFLNLPIKMLARQLIYLYLYKLIKFT